MGCCCSSDDRSLDAYPTERTSAYVQSVQNVESCLPVTTFNDTGSAETGGSLWSVGEFWIRKRKRSESSDTSSQLSKKSRLQKGDTRKEYKNNREIILDANDLERLSSINNDNAAVSREVPGLITICINALNNQTVNSSTSTVDFFTLHDNNIAKVSSTNDETSVAGTKPETVTNTVRIGYKAVLTDKKVVQADSKTNLTDNKSCPIEKKATFTINESFPVKNNAGNTTQIHVVLSSTVTNSDDSGAVNKNEPSADSNSKPKVVSNKLQNNENKPPINNTVVGKRSAFLKKINSSGLEIEDPTLTNYSLKYINDGLHAREWIPQPTPVAPGITKFIQRNPKSEFITSSLHHYPHRLLNDPKPPLWQMTPLSTRLFMNNHDVNYPIGDDLEYLTMVPGSCEFNEIRSLFKATTKAHYEVFSIYKVINKWLLALYALKQEEYRILYGADNIKEHMLFHGTSKVNGESICHNNFNWRCYKNDKKFGHGVNFSAISNYASHYSKEKEPLRVMFAARVISSNHCDGSKAMLVPPYYDTNKLLRYDTAQKPNGHVKVKFNDDEFYPSYIIYFTENNNTFI